MEHAATAGDEEAAARKLRMALVDDLRGKGSVRSAAVEAAMRAVPRHVFLPGVPLERAYANDVVVTKSAADGSSLSLASQPGVVATMLEQLDVQAGDRVLEIGAGTGYNAALLACLVGVEGRVTTVDLDEDITDAALRNLAVAGYERVRVVCGDGEFGAENDAPFDRLIATVSAWDLSPSWLDQLSRDGRIVVPLRLRGLIRSVAFERADGHLVSGSVEPAGFVPMRGAGAYQEQLVRLGRDESVTLKIDGSTPADADALRSAAGRPAQVSWTGVTIGAQESFCPLDLWLAGIDGFCRISARSQPEGTGLVRLALPVGTAALVGKESFAYLTVRKASVNWKWPPRTSARRAPCCMSCATSAGSLLNTTRPDRQATPPTGACWTPNASATTLQPEPPSSTPSPALHHPGRHPHPRMRFTDHRARALLAACCALAHRPAGFTSRDLRHYLAPQLGKQPEEMTSGQISHDLRRLRATTSSPASRTAALTRSPPPA